MSLEVIYVVRHGFRSGWTVDPITGVYSTTLPSPTGIAADPALTSHGATQAEELGRHLMTVEPPIDVVYSSPYYRCLQTITPYVDLRRRHLHDGGDGHDATSIRAEHGICEWFGSAPFDHPEPASAQVLKSMFPVYDESYVSARRPSRKGETLTQLYERVAESIHAIIDRCDSEGRRTVVLCTHAAVVIALGRVLTGQIPDDPSVQDFGAFTCGLSVYRRRQAGREGEEGASTAVTSPLVVGQGQWHCELNSDCSFLSSGAERGWMFSGDESFPGTGSMSQNTTTDTKL